MINTIMNFLNKILEKIKFYHSKKWYINKIKGFVMHMTTYQGEWCEGFNHKYQIHIQDVIPLFVIFEIRVNNGNLSFFGYDLKYEREETIQKGEKILTKKYARGIYKILKSIDIFWYQELKED